MRNGLRCSRIIRLEARRPVATGSAVLLDLKLNSSKSRGCNQDLGAEHLEGVFCVIFASYGCVCVLNFISTIILNEVELSMSYIVHILRGLLTWAGCALDVGTEL